MTTDNPLMKVSLDEHYEDFGEHKYSTTHLVYTADLPAFIEEFLGGIYDDVDPDDSDMVPRPTTQHVLEAAVHGNYWSSRPAGQYQDYHTVHIGPIIAWTSPDDLIINQGVPA